LAEGTGTSYFTGDVSEIIMYQNHRVSRALSARERAVLENYLMTKSPLKLIHYTRTSQVFRFFRNTWLIFSIPSISP
jgi:hypothetical protein